MRTLSKHGKLAATEVERLERNVALLVKTLDVKRKTKSVKAGFYLKKRKKKFEFILNAQQTSQAHGGYFTIILRRKVYIYKLYLD